MDPDPDEACLEEFCKEVYLKGLADIVADLDEETLISADFGNTRLECFRWRGHVSVTFSFVESRWNHFFQIEGLMRKGKKIRFSLANCAMTGDLPEKWVSEVIQNWPGDAEQQRRSFTRSKLNIER